MIKEIAENAWKLNVDSNIYLLRLKEDIIIDTGPGAYKDTVKRELSKITDLENIKKVILTHVHYDHSGNIDLFPNANIYASKKEIEGFRKNPLVAFNLNPRLILRLRKELIEIQKIKDFLDKNNIKIIETPGHTTGSICLFYKKEKILFSGDTLFFNGAFGRTDLPNSLPEEMEKSLEKLEKIDFKILAPGHDY